MQVIKIRSILRHVCRYNDVNGLDGAGEELNVNSFRNAWFKYMAYVKVILDV